MADYEVSKLMWMAIVIALAASIFTIAKPEIKTLADGVFGQIENVVKGIDTGDGTETPSTNPDDYEQVSNYAENGTFAIKADGTAVLWATDDSKPIEVKGGTMAYTQGDNAVAGKTAANPNLKSLTIVSPLKITGDAMIFFGNNPKLESIKGLDKVDVSGVTSMQQLFANDSALKSVNVSNWNTSNVTNLNTIFADASSLRSIDISNWDTSKVTDMTSAFATGLTSKKSALTELKLGNINTSKVTTFTSMLTGTSNLKAVPDVEKLDFSAVTNGGSQLAAMFANSGIEHLDFSKAKFPAEIDTSSLFATMPNLKTVKLGQNIKLKSVSQMFGGDAKTSAYTNKIESIDLTGADLSAVAVNDAKSMFAVSTPNLKTFNVPYTDNIAQGLKESGFVPQSVLDGYKK